MCPFTLIILTLFSPVFIQYDLKGQEGFFYFFKDGICVPGKWCGADRVSTSF